MRCLDQLVKSRWGAGKGARSAKASCNDNSASDSKNKGRQWRQVHERSRRSVTVEAYKQDDAAADLLQQPRLLVVALTMLGFGVGFERERS